MKSSKYNLIVEIDKSTSAVVNTLTGAVDIILNQDIHHLNGKASPENNKIVEHFYDRQYLIDDDIDEKSFVENLFKSLTKYRREQNELTAVIILTFDCNLRCTYCWQQDNIDKSHKETITCEKVDKIFDSISEIMMSLENVKDDNVTIQLFGGEPLLYENKDIVEYILNKCSQKNWSSQITTNGSQLKEYMHLFEKYDVAEIQITVDGSSEIHEKRRVGSSYNELMNSVDSLLQLNKSYVKLRVNIDDENIDSIPLLSDEIIERKWYTNKKFYPYLAPLRDSSLKETNLMKNRSNLLKKFLEKRKEYPQIEIFDVLGWNGYETVKNLENTGKIPYPKGHICDVNMNHFIFTPNGEIHLCNEEAHDSKASVGKYWPEFFLNEDSFANRYEKSPLELKGCVDCEMLPICGGGCQMFENNEKHKEEYCKSIKECFSLGLKNYIETEGLN